MNDLRLRELLRPLAEAVAPAKTLDAQRKVEESFRDDGLIDRRIIAGALPPQRIDLVVPPGASAGLQPQRYFVPEDSRGVRIALVSSGNASATFGIDILVNGVVRGSGAIRTGMNRSTGTLNVALPAGSVVSVEIKTSIPQGVTVSIFLQSTSSSSSSSGSGSGGSGGGGGGGTGAVASVNGQTGVVLLDADSIDDATTSHKFVTAAEKTKLANTSGTNSGDQDLSGYATTSALTSGLAGKATAAQGAKADTAVQPGDLPPTVDQLTDLDTTVSGSQLNALKTKVDGVDSGATANATNAQLRDRSTHTGAQVASTISDFQPTVSANADVTANTSARHTHTNKATLDAVTAAFTTAEKTKLSGIASGAEVNVQSNWAAASGDAAILNKPATYAPSPHNQTASTITDFSAASDARIAAQKAIANGLATLDAAGKLPSSQLPAIALTDVHVVASQAAQLALTVQEGDVAIRTDLNLTFINNGGTSGTMADWSEILAPTGGGSAVSSVNGKTGTVTLLTTDIAEGTNLYYTDARVSASPAVAASTAASHTHPNKATLDATTAAFTSAMDAKLSGIAAGAEVNVQADWDAASGDAAILNKPAVNTVGRVQNQPNDIGVDNVHTIIVRPGLTLITGPTGVVYIEPVFGGSGANAIAARSDHNHDGTYTTTAEVNTGIDTALAYQPIPFTAIVAEARASTTEIVDFVATTISPSTITVPAGTYQVEAVALASGRRSVDSGSIQSRLVIGGVLGPTTSRAVDSATPGTNNQTARFSDTITTGGTVSLAFQFKGNSTPATTRMYQGVLTGTLTRIS